MSLSFNCTVSLSKKIRSMLQDNANLILTAQIVNGKGVGRVLIDNNTDVTDITSIGETSIMLTPTELSEVSPGNEDSSVCNIFGANINNKESSEVVKKIAAVNAPEKKEISTAITTPKVPKAFKEITNPQCQNYIKNTTELVNAVLAAKNKSANIDLTGITNARLKAVAMEEKEKAEAIDVPAYIVNDQTAMIFVNDLEITLAKNMPYDLRNISAKRLANSKDLMGLLKTGYVKFINPDEANEYASKVVAEEKQAPGLDVYDHHEEAEAAIETMPVGEDDNPNQPQRGIRRAGSVLIDDNKAMDITEENMGQPTEDESMIMNLNMPTVKKTNSNVPRQSSNTPQAPKANDNRTIRPRHREE